MASLSYPAPAPYTLLVGWVGVGWQRHCKTCRLLIEIDNQGTDFVFGGRSQLVVKLDVFVRDGLPLYFAQVGMIVSRSVDGKAPERRLHSTPNAVFGSGHTGN